MPATDLAHIEFQGRLRPPRAHRSETLSSFAHGGNGATEAPPEMVRASFDSMGIALEPYKNDIARRRIAACLRRLRVGSAAEAERVARENPSAHRMVVDEILLGVTEFFREPDVFERLRETLPSLNSNGMRVWSAGCSSGEELYTMAFLLHDAGLLERAMLLGTDIRRTATQAAEAAVYADEAVHKHIAPETAARYFDPAENPVVPDTSHAIPPSGIRAGTPPAVSRSVVKPAIRRRCLFARHDILTAPPGADWDIILCCNVFIYMKPWAGERAMRLMADSLRTGGLLILGKAERPCKGLPLRHISRCIYQKTS